MPNYENSVFINCPFDEAYKPLRNALLFAVHDCGFVARCALDADDSARIRIQKIIDIIHRCKYGIHDISRTETTAVHGEHLPRFNMPYELGLFIGAIEFGTEQQRSKRCLVLDRTRYRYQAFISDIAGQDIKPHNDNANHIIRCVRDWLKAQMNDPNVMLPGATAMVKRYNEFQDQLPKMCEVKDIDVDELTHADYMDFMFAWLSENSST